MRRIAQWLAVAMALAAGAAAAQPLHPEGEGTIRGRIVREAGPAAGLPVVLYAISEAGAPGVTRSVSDDRGHFVFAGVSTNPNTVYLVGVHAHEIPFGTRASFAAGQQELEVEVRIAAFDTDTSVARSGDSTLRIDRSCEELRVSEAHELHNPTDRVIYLREAERAGRKPLFSAEIPALASDFATPPGTLPESLERTGKELRFWGPLHPGSHRLEFSYALPGEPGRLELARRSASATPRLAFLTHPRGPQVRGARLRAAGERSVEGRAYRAVEATQLAAGERLAYSLAIPPAPEAPISLVHSKIWLELDDAALAVEEQHVLRVEGEVPLVAESDAPLLCLALPAGAGGLRFSPTSLAIGLDPDSSGVLAVRGPIPPGDSTLALGYRLPVEGGALRFERRFPRALPLLSVVVADTGILAETTRLHRLRSIRREERTYLQLEGFEIEPQERVVIDLRQLPARRSLSALASTGFAALAAAGAIAFLIAPLRGGRQPEENAETRAGRLAAEREVVYASIRDLDEDFDTGKLTSQDHAALRGELRAQAVRLLQEERAEREAAPAAAVETTGCASCGAELPQDARFCPGCGVGLAKPEGTA